MDQQGEMDLHPDDEKLRINDVSVFFGGVAAVNECSFGVGRGVTSLIGPNGAGKSTLVSVIAGSVRPTKGYITFEGRRLRGPMHVRVKQGVVRTFQLPQEFGRMTVFENVMVAARGNPGTRTLSALAGPKFWGHAEDSIAARAWDILGRCDLTRMADEYASTLSGGQKKLLEMARALMCEPHLLILDEPLAGVAPHLAAQLRDVILDVKNRGTIVLIIEHEMRWVQELSDRVVVLALGKPIASGSFDEVSSQASVQAAYLGSVPGGSHAGH